jgi:GNAT superfamily N-acetyltransferase
MSKPCKLDGEPRLWSEGDSINDLTALLHCAYAKWVDHGIRFVASYQDDGTTATRIRERECWILTSAGTIVGTVTLYLPKPDSPCEWYKRPGVAVLCQLAVEPTHQRHGHGRGLVTWCEQRAVALGAKDLALDTAERLSTLIAWYEGLGFRKVDYHQWRNVEHRNVVLSKDLSKNPLSRGEIR